MIVSCRNCGDDFDTATDCPTCGSAWTEPFGHPVGPTCGACGADRYALNGEPLALGDPCAACSSMRVQMPRKPGQFAGTTIEGRAA